MNKRLNKNRTEKLFGEKINQSITKIRGDWQQCTTLYAVCQKRGTNIKDLRRPSLMHEENSQRRQMTHD